MQTALTAWAASTTPRGDVAVHADALEAYAALEMPPRGFSLALWWAGDSPNGPTDDIVGSAIGVGVAIAKGLTRDPHTELLGGTAARATPVLDIIEGVTATLRGLHIGGQPAPGAPASCYLLRYTGSSWIKFEVGVAHYVHQLNFQLSRQIPARQPLQVTL